MFRTLFRWTAGLAAVFITSIGFIRARPYNHDELLAILQPAAMCDAPCFIGIQPGRTSIDAALEILGSHPWIGDVKAFHNSGTGKIDLVNWNWSGKQPAVMSGSSEDSRRGTLTARFGIVNYIGLATGISLGDIWVQWGIPEEYWLRTNHFVRTSPARLAFLNIYKAQHLRVSSSASCPYYPGIWNAPVSIYLGEGGDIIFPANAFYFETQPFPDRVIDLMQRICRD